jgi:hypothetical protein
MHIQFCLLSVILNVLYTSNLYFSGILQLTLHVYFRLVKEGVSNMKHSCKNKPSYILVIGSVDG